MYEKILGTYRKKHEKIKKMYSDDAFGDWHKTQAY